jgi:CRP/FNR family transcriptional regulator
MKKKSCTKCDSTDCFINRFVSREWKKKVDAGRILLPFEKGESIFREGDPVSGIYFIYEGKVKVFNSGLKGKAQIVRFANSGDILGHRGFGKTHLYPIGAAALEPSTLCFVPTALFLQMLDHNHAMVIELLEFYADELRRAENKLRVITQLSVKQKMAEAIVTLSEIYGMSRSGTTDFLNVQLSRQEYAEITGASLEEVIRTISQLRKEGIIRSEKKRIGIANWKKMKALLSDFGPFRLP